MLRQRLVASGTPATVIIVIHAWEIIVHERIGVMHSSAHARGSALLTLPRQASAAARQRIGRSRLPPRKDCSASPCEASLVDVRLRQIIIEAPAQSPFGGTLRYAFRFIAIRDADCSRPSMRSHYFSAQKFLIFLPIAR